MRSAGPRDGPCFSGVGVVVARVACVLRSLTTSLPHHRTRRAWSCWRACQRTRRPSSRCGGRRWGRIGTSCGNAGACKHAGPTPCPAAQHSANAALILLTPMQALAKATTLSFEFYREEASVVGVGSGKVSIVVPALDKLPEDEQEIMRQLVQRFNVPEQNRCGGAARRSAKSKKKGVFPYAPGTAAKRCPVWKQGLHPCQMTDHACIRVQVWAAVCGAPCTRVWQPGGAQAAGGCAAHGHGGGLPVQPLYRCGGTD